jgi:hypothetical protein
MKKTSLELKLKKDKVKKYYLSKKDVIEAKSLLAFKEGSSKCVTNLVSSNGPSEWAKARHWLNNKKNNHRLGFIRDMFWKIKKGIPLTENEKQGVINVYNFQKRHNVNLKSDDAKKSLQVLKHNTDLVQKRDTDLERQKKLDARSKIDSSLVPHGDKHQIIERKTKNKKYQRYCRNEGDVER